MDDKVWAALQELGFNIQFRVRHQKHLPPFNAPWAILVPEPLESLADVFYADGSEDDAKQACLDHLRDNKEALMNRMVKAIGRCTIRPGDDFSMSCNWLAFLPFGTDETRKSAEFLAQEDEPCDAVYALWSKLKGAH